MTIQLKIPYKKNGKEKNNMATRDSLVFAAKIFDYLEDRKQILNKEYSNCYREEKLDDVRSKEVLSAFNELDIFYTWLCEH